MKNNTTLLFVSLMALALAVMSLFGSRVETSSNSAMTVVAICTTMIVGVSVLDRMTIHDLEKRLDELKDVEMRLEEIKTRTNIIHHIDLGLAFFTWKPDSTIKEFYKAIEIAMKANDVKRTHICVDNLQKLVNILKERKVTNDEKKRMMDNLMDIKDTDLYPIIRDQLNKVFKSIEELQVK